MFHALSDGNGGLLFLKALVCQYLKLQHPARLANLVPETVAPAANLAQDSYRQFYGAAARRDAVPRRACRIRGGRLPYDQTQFFEAHLPVDAVLAAARAEGVTLTSWLGARLMLAIYAEIPQLERRRPVAISLPVNLRNYYPSETARNFSTASGWGRCSPAGRPPPGWPPTLTPPCGGNCPRSGSRPAWTALSSSSSCPLSNRCRW